MKAVLGMTRIDLRLDPQAPPTPLHPFPHLPCPHPPHRQSRRRQERHPTAREHFPRVSFQKYKIIVMSSWPVCGEPLGFPGAARTREGGEHSGELAGCMSVGPLVSGDIVGDPISPHSPIGGSTLSKALLGFTSKLWQLNHVSLSSP